MAFKGALLKPSEKSGAGAVSRRSSQKVAKQSRYEVLKEKVRTWWDDRVKVGEALREIRDHKLYEHEHDTFEAFCQSEYGFERAHAYRLIGFSDVKDSIKMSPIGDKITRESQARALAHVPVEKREEVIEKVAEKGPVTAKAITEAAQEVVKPEPAKAAKEEKQKHFDKTGYPIPDAILKDWRKAESYRPALNDLQRIRLDLEKALANNDVPFRRIGQDTVIDLKNAWTALKQVLPYAVCPTCQGRTRSKCAACKEMGFVSQFGYEHWFAKEVIEVRERAIKK